MTRPPLYRALDRWRRLLREPALNLSEQPVAFVRAEHSADCVVWYKRSADLIKQVALGKLRPLIGPINGRVHARLYERRGIDDHDPEQATVPIVREPEARHASNLLGPDGPRN
jgi:hypothetical protein